MMMAPAILAQARIWERDTRNSSDLFVCVHTMSTDGLTMQVFTGPLQPATGKGNMVDVMLRIQTPATGQRVPVDIVCVLDISDSMGDSASIAGQEPNGPSLLDVAKHGVKTVLNTLGDEDRLAIVLFNHTSIHT